jgi:hypothetical protein
VPARDLTSATAVALAASVALCVAFAMDVEVRHVRVPIVVAEEQPEPPDAQCGEEYFAALQHSWSQLDQREASLRDPLLDDREQWREVARQIEWIAKSKAAIRSRLLGCRPAPQEVSAMPRSGCG